MLINFALFEGLTQLDLTGPYEVLSRMPGPLQIELVGLNHSAVHSDRGLILFSSVPICNSSPCDLLVIPGGPGVDEAMLNPDWLRWLRKQANEAKLVLGVCTGSLLLGATGLLHGRAATSHWQARDLLAQFGALSTGMRVSRDGKFWTAAGVTSGIDAALHIVAELHGDAVAKQIQLQIEYDPEPPFRGGSFRSSDRETVRRCIEATTSRRAIRVDAVAKAARFFKGPV